MSNLERKKGTVLNDKLHEWGRGGGGQGGSIDALNLIEWQAAEFMLSLWTPRNT